MNTPILFLVFNRPNTTQKVFEEIRKARPTRLFIAADGPRPQRPDDEIKCKEVRAICDAVDWPCEVTKLYREKNLGCQLAPSQAVTWFFEHVESGIILEDDCIPDQTFFPFCTELLERYKDDIRVWQISGNFFHSRDKKFTYGNSYFFSSFPYLWGWASWRRAWKHYDIEMKTWPEKRDNGIMKKIINNDPVYEYWSRLWNGYYNGKRNSWDRPWAYAFIEHGALSINPTKNLISNIGFGEEATHTKDTTSELSDMVLSPLTFPLIHPKEIKADLRADMFAYTENFGVNKTILEKIKGTLRRNIPFVYLLLGKIKRWLLNR